MSSRLFRPRPATVPRPGVTTAIPGAVLSVLLLASCGGDVAGPDGDAVDDPEASIPGDVAIAEDVTGTDAAIPPADSGATSGVHGAEASLDANVVHGVAAARDTNDGVEPGTRASTAVHAATAIERMRAGRARAPVTEDEGIVATLDGEGTVTPAGSPVTSTGGAETRSAAPVAFDWRIPDWLPPPPVPADNPMSEAKVRLGRHLFHDHRLSADDSVACASCHDQSLGFSDGRPLAVGIHGSEARRNAMGLANVGYSPVLTWSNPYLTSLERQSLVPLFGEEPLEMGMSGREIALFERLASDPDYASMFADAFPEREGEVNLATITRALAAFQRTLISVGSAYDAYKYGGDADALDASALRGEMLFFSETAECYHCHQGFNFTDTLQTSRSAYPEVAFHNTGLYDIDGRGTYPPGQQGLRELSGRDADMGRFRTPSLRNVAVTAPYFHDGSAATLDDVFDHYAAGGRTVDGPHAGVGRNNPLKDSLVKGFALDEGMRADLAAFLDSLTDEAFLTEPRFSDPWPDGHPARGRTVDDTRDPPPPPLAPVPQTESRP